MTEDNSKFSFANGILIIVGALAIQFISVPIGLLVQIFYSPPSDAGKTIFMSTAMTGIALGLGKLMDLPADPIIGAWSDRVRSKLGRRRPFIIFGSIPLSIVFFLFWLPPVHGQSIWNFVWALSMVALYWWIFTLVLIPFLALQPEIATNSKSRVTLGAYYSIGMYLGFAISMVLAPMMLDKLGPMKMGLAFSIASLCLFQIFGWLVKERHIPSAVSDIKKSGVGEVVREFFTAFLSTFKIRAFVIFVVSAFLFNIGFNAVQPFIMYFNIQILCRPQSGTIFIPFLICGLLSVPFIPLINKKFNKKGVFTFGQGLMAVLFVSFTVIALTTVSMNIPSLAGFGADTFTGKILGFIGIDDGVISPLTFRFILTLVVISIAAIPQTIIYAYNAPILGEIIDLDEIETGQRREAIYSGVQNVIMKGGIALGPFFLGLVLMLGNTKANPTGLLLVGPIMGVISLFGALLFLAYPIINLEKEREKRNNAK